ncbi:hypothetical protein BZARG_917 [Bizionia argentinensis JUB59]|uniref:Uncharacterized protein n=1 Tax=Bizionia argentinensis JUB59 TaxID=1046627 RepID=G2EBN8_9FLAO|nr:hypothetical protein [Bizionia argentinensis]EGV44132.1 hypothetical protein BZARG_917 [Bizionia argentinensis JUB59]
MKNLKNLGKALTRAEQKEVSAGKEPANGQGCGYYQINSTEQICLNMPYKYRPQWIPQTGMCSILGQAPCN